MENADIERAIEFLTQSAAKHDAQLDTVVGVLASLADRLSGLVRLAEIQNERITRLESK